LQHFAPSSCPGHHHERPQQDGRSTGGSLRYHAPASATTLVLFLPAKQRQGTPTDNLPRDPRVRVNVLPFEQPCSTILRIYSALAVPRRENELINGGSPHNSRNQAAAAHRRRMPTVTSNEGGMDATMSHSADCVRNVEAGEHRLKTAYAERLTSSGTGQALAHRHVGIKYRFVRLRTTTDTRGCGLLTAATGSSRARRAGATPIAVTDSSQYGFPGHPHTDLTPRSPLGPLATRAGYLAFIPVG